MSKLKGTNQVYDGYFKMLEATVETSTGETVKRELFSRASRGNSEDAVAAVVYDTVKDRYIFTKQFRVGLYRENDMEIIEAVAGTLKEGEDPKECMIREIEEELGYATDSIVPTDEFYVSPGGCAEKIYLFFATVSNKISDGGGLAEEHEEIETIEMSYDEMKEFVFRDAKTIIGVQKIENKSSVENLELHTITYDIMNAIDTSLTSFGAYTFSDKGVHEVMNTSIISDKLITMSIEDIACVLTQVLDNYPIPSSVGNTNHSTETVEAIINDLDSMDNFDELFDFDERFEY